MLQTRRIHICHIIIHICHIIIQVLEAYICYRPDVGYVQGMSYLAAMLILYLEPYPVNPNDCSLMTVP